MFDTNCDGKISQYDIFKLMHNFCKSPSSDRFVNILYEDIIQISKKISMHLKVKRNETLAEND